MTGVIIVLLGVKIRGLVPQWVLKSKMTSIKGMDRGTFLGIGLKNMRESKMLIN